MEGLRQQKIRWARKHNSWQVAAEAAPGNGTTMAQKHTGHTLCLSCSVSQWETSVWQDPGEGFSPLHFMQCLVCCSIVSGTGTAF